MNVGARRVASSEIYLSAITFGSMRMHERAVDDIHWRELLIASIESGISTCHSSSEYESFPLFCRVLERLRTAGRAKELQHIVKLAEPHFGEFAFEPKRLEQRVDGYLSALGLERLDVVQWMWRGDLKREQARIAGFEDYLGAIAAAFDDLAHRGKIGAVIPFPYTRTFGDLALAQSWCAGLALYLNPLELESLDLVTLAAASNRSVVALRPLAAGRVLEAGHAVADALRWTLTQPSVVTGVVSYSSMEHLAGLTA